MINLKKLSTIKDKKTRKLVAKMALACEMIKNMRIYGSKRFNDW